MPLICISMTRQTILGATLGTPVALEPPQCNQTLVGGTRMFKKILIGSFSLLSFTSLALAQSSPLHIVRELASGVPLPGPYLDATCSINNSGAVIFNDGAGSLTKAFYDGQVYQLAATQRPLSINASFQMVGYTQPSPGSATLNAGFWGTSGPQALSASSAASSGGADNNSQGYIVGFSAFPTGAGSTSPHATAWLSASSAAIDLHPIMFPASLPTSYSYAAAISDSNKVLAIGYDGSQAPPQIRLFDPTTNQTQSLTETIPSGIGQVQVVNADLNNNAWAVATLRTWDPSTNYTGTRALAYPPSAGSTPSVGGFLSPLPQDTITWVANVNDTNTVYGYSGGLTGIRAVKWQLVNGSLVQAVNLNTITQLPAGVLLTKAACSSPNGNLVVALAAVNGVQKLLLLSY
ncbi:MAG: hypothetical protein K1X79_14120 [Oligoflexia bacterium]|nr:hypothetical protein [Oligoflexia bacterium]